MTETAEAKPVYEFGVFQLDPAGRTLNRDGQPVPLSPKLIDTLVVLVEHNGQVMEKDELLRLIWPDNFVEENNLSQNIFHLRKALGDNPPYIETISRRGYRFAATVREIRQNGQPDSTSLQKPVVSASAQIATTQFPARTIIFSMTGAAFVFLLMFALTRNWSRKTAAEPVVPFSHPQITRLTNTLDVRTPALSRDGKYLAYVVSEAGRQSLRVRQTVRANEMQIVAPAERRYRGLTFSPDGNFIYFTAYEKPGASGMLARLPVLGGAPEQLSSDADSPVTFSPDGKQMAFVRYFTEAAIIVADPDGRNERRLAVRNKPDLFSVEGLAWSPDGKWIACAVGNNDDPVPYMTLAGVETMTGQETRITTQRFSGLSQVAWLSNGQGLMAIVHDTAAPLSTSQLWHFAWPGDSSRRITNDLSGWRWVSASSEAAQLVTVQSSRVAQFQLVPGGDASLARNITFGSGDATGEKLGMTWTPDGRLVYASYLNGNADLWLMNADGSQRRQLTDNPGADYQPAVSPDGRYLLYASSREGSQSHIWRMDLQNGSLQQLTFGKDDENPTVTPDGQWALYTTRGQGHWTMWKVSIAGGAAQQLTQLATQKPMVSPDGKLIACYFYDEAKRSYRLAMLPIEGGRAIRFFDAPIADLLPIYWTPDGRSLIYVDTREGVSNLWQQPIDGSAPKQITRFQSGRIFRYAWSRAGNTLACERGAALNDLVIIRQSQ